MEQAAALHPVTGKPHLSKPLPNGFIALAVSEVLHPDDVPRRIVLGARDGDFGTEFVTWMRREDNGYCHWGHYDHVTVDGALKDYHARVKRGF